MFGTFYYPIHTKNAIRVPANLLEIVLILFVCIEMCFVHMCFVHISINLWLAKLRPLIKAENCPTKRYIQP